MVIIIMYDSCSVNLCYGVVVIDNIFHANNMRIPITELHILYGCITKISCKKYIRIVRRTFHELLNVNVFGTITSQVQRKIS